MIAKQLRHESKKLRDSARGRDCQVRIPGVCNFNPETTVLAHLNGGGMGTKKSDIHSAFTCSSCHDVLDGRVSVKSEGLTKVVIELLHRQGVERTQQLWLDEGLIKI